MKNMRHTVQVPIYSDSIQRTHEIVAERILCSYDVWYKIWRNLGDWDRARVCERERSVVNRSESKVKKGQTATTHAYFLGISWPKQQQHQKIMLILTRTPHAITIRSIQHEWVIKWDEFWLADGADCGDFFFSFVSQLVDVRTHFYRAIYQLLWFSIWIITIYELKFSIENYYRIKIA